MWQTIEFKAAAIEQFRKGDLLQRSIEDVQSEAANAAEMKAAASGNPLILMQVQLASDLSKLEALYSQYQRSQHRMRDSLKILASADARLAKREENHALDSGHHDSNTDKYMDSGKERIRLHFFKDGKIHTDKDSETLKGFIVDGVKESMKLGKSSEMETIKVSIDKPFAQFEELALVRENHSAVIRELQRMQDKAGYVSAWTPKEKLPSPVEAPVSSITMRVA